MQGKGGPGFAYFERVRRKEHFKFPNALRAGGFPGAGWGRFNR